MREVLPHLSSMWLSQGSALYSQERPFGDRMQWVTKQKANLKLAILIPPVKFLTAHLNPSPHLDIETKWVQKSQLCQNQGVSVVTLTGIRLCSCSFWVLPFPLDLQPQRSVLFCPAERNLSCTEDLCTHFTVPSVGASGGSCGNAELQVSTGHVTNDISGCLIRGISLVRVTSGFVADDTYCCECTEAAIIHRSVQWVLSQLPKKFLPLATKIPWGNPRFFHWVNLLGESLEQAATSPGCWLEKGQRRAYVLSSTSFFYTRSSKPLLSPYCPLWTSHLHPLFLQGRIRCRSLLKKQSSQTCFKANAF